MASTFKELTDQLKSSDECELYLSSEQMRSMMIHACSSSHNFASHFVELVQAIQESRSTLYLSLDIMGGSNDVPLEPILDALALLPCLDVLELSTANLALAARILQQFHMTQFTLTTTALATTHPSKHAEEGLAALANALKSHHTIQDFGLTIESDTCHRESLETIISALTVAPKLYHVNFFHFGAPSADEDDNDDQVDKHATTTTSDTTNQQDTVKRLSACSAISRMFTQQPELVSLHLQGFAFDNEAACLAFADNISSSSILSFSMEKCSIGNSYYATVMAKGFAANRNLTGNIVLNQNSFPANFYKELGTALAKMSFAPTTQYLLTQQHLDDMNRHVSQSQHDNKMATSSSRSISSRDSRDSSETGQDTTTSSDLLLSGGGVAPTLPWSNLEITLGPTEKVEYVRPIVLAIRTNATLQKLALSKTSDNATEQDEEFYTALSFALKANNSLRILKLTNIAVQKQSCALSLAAGLGFNRSLKHLELTDCQLNDKFFLTVVSALEIKNNTLQSLVVDYSTDSEAMTISDKAHIAAVRLLHHNTALHKLSCRDYNKELLEELMDDNISRRMSHELAQSLLTAVKENYGLHELAGFDVYDADFADCIAAILNQNRLKQRKLPDVIFEEKARSKHSTKVSSTSKNKAKRRNSSTKESVGVKGKKNKKKERRPSSGNVDIVFLPTEGDAGAEKKEKKKKKKKSTLAKMLTGNLRRRSIETALPSGSEHVVKTDAELKLSAMSEQTVPSQSNHSASESPAIVET